MSKEKSFDIPQRAIEIQDRRLEIANYLTRITVEAEIYLDNSQIDRLTKVFDKDPFATTNPTSEWIIQNRARSRHNL